MLIKYSCNLFSHYFITKNQENWLDSTDCVQSSPPQHTREIATFPCFYSIMHAQVISVCLKYGISTQFFLLGIVCLGPYLFWNCFGVCLCLSSLNSVTHTHTLIRGASQRTLLIHRGKSENVPDHQGRWDEVTDHQMQVRWCTWSPGESKLMYLINRGASQRLYLIINFSARHMAVILSIIESIMLKTLHESIKSLALVLLLLPSMRVYFSHLSLWSYLDI